MAAGGVQADVGRFREFPCLCGLECRAACRLGGAMRSESLELQQEDGGEHQMGACVSQQMGDLRV